MTSLNDEKDNSGRTKEIPMVEVSGYTGVPTAEFDNGRAEKPWQRVPCTLLILLLGVYLLLGYLTQLVEDDMPAVIKEADIARDNSVIFSEEAAWKYLDQIIGEEPRVAGTLYHYQKTRDMKALVDGIAGQANLTVRTDWQLATGDYYLQKTSAPFVNYYQHASNIIALLEGESGFHSNGTIGSSILLNCHYDSVPYALGASDNAVFCAVLAETLNKLSRRTNKFKHNIVFLFNGAEENPLQASHAFLQHPWSKGVTSVVNLDAAGMNGKPAIFQVTDPRVLNAYKRTVRNPNAQGLGEFLFSSGIIPSDTDFRIFRDYGDIHGIDIAFTKWGHVYHTRYDHPSMIREGVLQGAGDMMLALVTELADMQELADKAPPTAAVYYDYLNVFVVTYSLGASYAVDVLVALFALATVAYYVWIVVFRVSTLKELIYSALGRVASMAAGVVVTAILVLIMVATTIQMRYLTEPWIVVPIFWMPYLITAVGVSHLYDSWRVKKTGFNRSIRTLQAMSATRLLLAVILLVLSCVPAVTTMRYLVTVPLFIMSLASLVSLTMHRYLRLTGWQQLVLEVVLSLPSVMFAYTLALRLDAMLLPIMARSAGNTPDYTVGVINVGLAIIVSSTVSGIELLFSRRRLWLVVCALGVGSLVIMFVPFSPYSDHGPSTQRHYWFHSEIVSFDMNHNAIERTSGVLVTKHDPYSLDRVVPALAAAGFTVNTRTDFKEDCENHIHCNLPLFRTSFGRYLKDGMLISTGAPAAFTPPPAAALPARNCAGELCTYQFVITGANHNLLTIWPRANISVDSWSFASPSSESFTQLDRPVYMIFHSTATYTEEPWSFNFNVTFRVPTSQQSQPIMDFSHHSHKIHHPADYTTEYKNILDAMPQYFNIASFLSFRYNYVF